MLNHLIKKTILKLLILILSVNVYGQINQDSIFSKVWSSKYPSKKIEGFVKLSKIETNTPQVLSAKGWLQFYNENYSNGIDILEKCIEEYPNFLQAYVMLYELLPDSITTRKVELLENIALSEASFHEYFSVIELQNLLLNRLEDEEGWNSFLRKVDLPVHLNKYVEGYAAELNGEIDTAKERYLEAINLSKDFFEPHEALARTNLGSVPIEEAFGPLISFLRNNEEDIRPFISIERFLSDDINKANIYQAAFNRDPNAELVQLYFYEALKVPHPEMVNTLIFDSNLSPSLQQVFIQSDSSAINPDSVLKFIEESNKIIPNNSLIHRILGTAYSEYLFKPRLSQLFFEKAVGYSWTLKDSVVNTIALAGFFESKTFNIEKSRELYKSLINKWPNREILYDALFISSLFSQDFAGAKYYLERSKSEFVKSGGNPEETWYRDRANALQRYSKITEEYSIYLANNKFLQSWIELFGSDLTCSISFDINSTELSNEMREELDLIGLLLNEDSSNKYFFSIDGHSDSRESDAEKVALERAKIIKNHLIRENRILPSRLHLNNYSNDIPIKNDLSSGRVEITPLGISETPKIAITSTLSSSRNLAYSPDGKVIATGNFPLQIWRLDGVKLKDLHSGRRSKFSDNGRYLASIATDIEAGGSMSTSSIKVYDTKTDFITHVIPSRDAVVDFSWSPSSDQLVYTTESGELVIYSINDSKKKRLTRIGTRSIGGPVIWLKNGKSILVGQAQHKVLKIFDSSSLKLERVLKGVDWPHQLGETFDSRFVLCSDNESILSIWNTRTWERTTIDSIPNFNQIPGKIVSHPFKPEIYVSDFGGGNHQRLVHVDVESGKILNHLDVGKDHIGVDISRDGKKLYVSNPSQNEVNVLDSRTLKYISSLKGESNSPTGAAFNSAINEIVTYDEKGAHFWDINGRSINSIQQHGINSIQVYSDSSYMMLVESPKEGLSRVKLIQNDIVSEIMTLDFNVDVVRIGEEYIAFAGKNFFPPDTISNNGVLEVFSKDFEFKSRITIPFATEDIRYDRLYDGGFESFDIDIGSQKVALTTYWQDGFGHLNSYSRLVRIYDFNSGELLDEISYRSARLYEVNFIETDLLDIKAGSFTITVDLAKRALVGGKQIGINEKLIPLSGEQFIKWSNQEIEFNNSVRNSHISYSNVPFINVGVFEDRNRIVTFSLANELSFFSLDSLKKLYSITIKKEDQWIAYSPDGKYSASPLGTKKVFWALGNRLLDFLSFKEDFETPNFLDRSVTPEAPSLLNFDPDFELNVDHADDFIETTEKSYWLSFSLKGKDKETVEIHFTHRNQDGDLISNSKGLKNSKLLNDHPNSLEKFYKKKIRLEDGLNLIDIKASSLQGINQTKRVAIKLIPEVNSSDGYILLSSTPPPDLKEESFIEINGNEVMITSITGGEDGTKIHYLSSDTKGNSIEDWIQAGITWIKTKRNQYRFYFENGRLEKFSNPYQNSAAVIVAIDDFDRDLNPSLGKTGYEPTDFLVKHAKELGSKLIPLGFSKENIIYITDQNATSTKIIEVLRSFWPGNKRSNVDRLLIYFAGHGDLYQHPKNELDKLGYLVTYDFDPESPTQKCLLMNDLISNGDKAAAKHVLFAIEACHSGLATKSLSNGSFSPSERFYTLNQIKSDMKYKARNVLLAGTGDQKALYANGGLFTKALINSLSGAGDLNKDGIIQFLELYLSIEKKVIGDASLISSYVEQKPHYEELETGNDRKGRVVFVTPTFK